MKKIKTLAAILLIVVIGCKQNESNKANINITGFWVGKYDLEEGNSTAHSDWVISFRNDGTCKAYDANISDTSNCYTYVGTYTINDSILSLTAKNTDNSGYEYIY
jgi:hypothetical protein